MSTTVSTVPVGAAPRVSPTAADDAAALIDLVIGLDSAAGDAELVERIATLEALKSACAATQVRLTNSLLTSRTAIEGARGIRPEVTRRGVAAEVGLARRESNFRGRRLVGLAAVLATDLPNLLAALQSGAMTEYRVGLVVDKFACLSQENRRHADELIKDDLASLGDRSAANKAAGIAYGLEPETVMAKTRGAVKDRHVSLRPAPDTMTRLSALLPVAQGVEVFAALKLAADAACGTGDGRGRGQYMADDLVSRITGQALSGCDDYGVPQFSSDPTGTSPAAGTDVAASGDGPHPSADAGTGSSHGSHVDAAADLDAADGHVFEIAAELARRDGVPDASCDRCAGRPLGLPGGVQLNLVMTDRTLLDGDQEPAHLDGYGSIPAVLARALVIGNADTATKTWIRRLYTDPSSGDLVAMDSRRRLFPREAQRFLLARDQVCRTPWCDAPVRQFDHITGYADGGATSIPNGQGLCQACNLAKQAPGWRSRAQADGSVRIDTPSGRSYLSRPPRPPKSQPWPEISWVEQRLAGILLDVA